MADKQLEEWYFEFGLQSESGTLIPESKCQELLDLIIDWAEENDFGISGHYSEIEDEE